MGGKDHARKERQRAAQVAATAEGVTCRVKQRPRQRPQLRPRRQRPPQVRKYSASPRANSRHRPASSNEFEIAWQIWSRGAVGRRHRPCGMSKSRECTHCVERRFRRGLLRLSSCFKLNRCLPRSLGCCRVVTRVREGERGWFSCSRCQLNVSKPSADERYSHIVRKFSEVLHFIVESHTHLRLIALHFQRRINAAVAPPSSMDTGGRWHSSRASHISKWA
jgi:hypothetical protein